MIIGGKRCRTVWLDGEDPPVVKIINQALLPHRFEIAELRSLGDAVGAIRDMLVRGAGLIGATAAWGMYLACAETEDFPALEEAGRALKATRPTASNLAWAVDRMLRALEAPGGRIGRARREAQALSDEDAECCRRIGARGLRLI
ncbi:MAG: S-methyl-5-thioribose-1-phosphate isomerase, partial [Treponema sp.]|nr:S-methyl-5-thioribose-1-phosphate isomerase [Treponema sp.]